MCGFLFLERGDVQLRKGLFEKALESQAWRGPDVSKIEIHAKRFILGHNRLSIIDPKSESDQPMTDASDKYIIVFNGEIYNFEEIKSQLNIKTRTSSDTEVLLEAYAILGNELFENLDGMFSLVILNKHTNEWVAARDHLGIKPLYYAKIDGGFIAASETVAIRTLFDFQVDYSSVDEWKSFRRPMPGKTYFHGIHELLPGHYIDSNGNLECYWKLTSLQEQEPFSQEKFDTLLSSSVKSHCMSDVMVTSLLSGGLDSSVVVKLSGLRQAYTTGLTHNNEVVESQEVANEIGIKVLPYCFSDSQMENEWRRLVGIRGEPLSVPNEALISLICKKMKSEEKVVLTGEGADELLFGYDRIFNKAINDEFDIEKFINMYTYDSSVKITNRMRGYIEKLWKEKTPIEFLEDFFIQFHLPGLLRRMDFSSMSASKEARVPFVTKTLYEYMYRRQSSIKINLVESKIPLRELLRELGVISPLSRKKIGFSAKRINKNLDDDYKDFQNICLEELGW
jgi:asparagine synthase (glutamine-hydrolysing)